MIPEEIQPGEYLWHSDDTRPARVRVVRFTGSNFLEVERNAETRDRREVPYTSLYANEGDAMAQYEAWLKGELAWAKREYQRVLGEEAQARADKRNASFVPTAVVREAPAGVAGKGE